MSSQLQLLYTNSETFLGDQRDPEKSVGGFISKTAVPNALVNNIFGDITYQQSRHASQFSETKCIAMKNLGPDAATDIRIWVNSPADSRIKLEIAVVAPHNDCDRLSFERLDNWRALPFSADFHEAEGEVNALELPDLPSGQYFGLFLKKTLTQVAQDQFLCENSDSAPFDEIEQMDLVIAWT